MSVLSSIFRARRPSTGRRRRFNPILDSLEGRQLLSGLLNMTDGTTNYTITSEVSTPVGVASNVVGAQAPFHTTLVSSDLNVTSTIQILSCSYSTYDKSGNLVDAFIVKPEQGPIVDASGYHGDMKPMVSATPTWGNSAYAQNTYWGATPGDYTVKTNVTWEDSRGLHTANPVYQTETVTQPTAVMTPNFYQGPNAISLVNYDTKGQMEESAPDSDGNWFDGTQFWALRTDGADPNNPVAYPSNKNEMTTPAIDLQVMVDPTQHGAADGTFGVVQTLQRNILAWQKDGDGQLQTYQYLLKDINGVNVRASTLLDDTPIDDTPDGKFTPYFGTYAYKTTLSQLEWKTGDTLEIKDSPMAQFAYGGRFGKQALSDDATFTDTVMFTPKGGIPVPITSMKWGYKASVALDGNGKPQLVPGSFSPADWKQKPSSTSAFPQWGDLNSNYSTGKIQVDWVDPPKLPTDLSIFVPPISTDPWDWGWDWEDPYPSRDPYAIG